MSVAATQKNTIDLSHDEAHPYRAVPLSTRKIFAIVAFLAGFSFVYLIYAQHHRLLFYVMTSLIAVWIVFIYISGIMAVLYMVRTDYDAKDRQENGVELQKQPVSTMHTT